MTFLPPADRTAIRRAAKINPIVERRRIAELFANVPHGEHFAAADIASSWPRLIHQLAQQGELAAPVFDTSAKPKGVAA